MIQGDKLGRHQTVADDLLAALNVAKEDLGTKEGNVTWLRTNDQLWKFKPSENKETIHSNCD